MELQCRKVFRVSKPCHSLCIWVHALYNYYDVNTKVVPKMTALITAEKTLTETEKILEGTMSKLREVEESIKKLQNQLNEEEAKKAELERQNQLCEERITCAVKLIVSLSDEEKRWFVMLENKKVSLKNAAGDILLTSGADDLIITLFEFYSIHRESQNVSISRILPKKIMKKTFLRY